MDHLFVRKDGDTYHYGATAPLTGVLGKLFLVSIEGEGIFPESPDSPATEAAHNLWLSTLEQAGFLMSIDPVTPT